MGATLTMDIAQSVSRYVVSLLTPAAQFYFMRI